MGTSTTGFVLTEDKNVFETLAVIDATLVALVKKYAKDIIQTSKLPKIQVHPYERNCQIYFGVNGEFRILSVHFDCDGDYRTYGDSKIIWSLGTWGMAEEIVLDVCQAMKQFGQVFYRASDAVTEDFVEI